MKFKHIAYTAVLLITSMLLNSCEDAWEERSAGGKADTNKSLLERLAAEPAASKFYEYVKSTGLDKVLESSNTFTVWAPSNDALSALATKSPSYLANAAELKKFVQYHIGYLDYPVSPSNDTIRVKTLTGKFRTIIKSKLEEATIIKADQYAGNGVLHVIDQANEVKGTIWDISHTLSGTAQQVSALNSLDTTVTVGGTTTIKRGPRWKPVADTMSLDSSKLYTYFVLNDAAYTQEILRMSPYFFTGSNKPDSTLEVLTKTALLKDVLVRGLYTADALPDSLTSVNKVKFPISKTSIIASYRASNGVVHVVNQLTVPLKYRVPAFTIQGEGQPGQIATTYHSNKAGNIYIRSKKDDKGVIFNDVEIYNHGQSGYWAQYQVPNVNSVVYKVYARAVSGTTGDLQKVNFTQRFGIRNPNSTNVNSNTAVVFTQLVTPLNYKEVYLGNYTKPKFGTLDWRLLSAATGTVNDNTMILDYVRFEPILP